MHSTNVVPELAKQLICICSPWAGCYYIELQHSLQSRSCITMSQITISNQILIIIIIIINDHMIFFFFFFFFLKPYFKSSVT